MVLGSPYRLAQRRMPDEHSRVVAPKKESVYRPLEEGVNVPNGDIQ